MLFTVVNGKPYMLGADGKIYSVRIDGDDVTIGEAVNVEPAGKYTLREIQAKCTDLDSTVSAKKTEAREEAEETKEAEPAVKPGRKKKAKAE